MLLTKAEVADETKAVATHSSSLFPCGIDNNATPQGADGALERTSKRHDRCPFELLETSGEADEERSGQASIHLYSHLA